MFFSPFSSSFLTLGPIRRRYLKHQGTKSNCFYIVILIAIFKTIYFGKFGSFWVFFAKKTVIFSFFQGWPIIWQKIWPTYSKIQVLMYNFTLFLLHLNLQTLLISIQRTSFARFGMKTNGKKLFLFSNYEEQMRTDQSFVAAELPINIISKNKLDV